ncbi:MAG: hypothetical protein A4E48_01014 [Methanosaeta sp. PtaU1.Bin060]|nr:MAG: hypothetical protein A4E48_01014 [Methanosaeta sp. PtaU1.Bin060]
MRIFALILSALLCSAVATAVPDSIVMGPYKVSFDLGLPKDAYSITVKEPKTTESLSGDISTKYKAGILNNTDILRFAYIDLSLRDKKQPTPTPEKLEDSLRSALLNESRISNIETSQRTIDGLPCAVVSYEFLAKGTRKTVKVFMAEYFPKIDKGSLNCIISSSYPWDEGTLALLQTIHIEKANATA